jgi:hypothetical protein
MPSIDSIRNGIIDKLLTISNKGHLKALYKIVTSNDEATYGDIELSEAQLLMLKRSEQDIKDNQLTPQSTVDEEDLKWLKKQ